METRFFFKLSIVFMCFESILGFACSMVQAQTGNQKLYISMLNASPKTKYFLAKNNIPNLLYFDGRYIDPKKTRTVNVKTLTDAIRKQIPDSLATGIAVLDWEGDMYNDLSYGLKFQSDAYNTTLNAYVQAIKLAKALRPRMKWGYYGMPFTMREKPTPPAVARWIESNNSLKPLLQQCDLLLPELYINGYEPGGNDAFITLNMQQFLILGKSMNKPVISYIWHRYYEEPWSKWSLKAIPVGNFTAFIKTILSVSYNNTKAAGVIWWGADEYYFYQQKSKALLNETTSQHYQVHEDSLIVSYTKEILKTINKLNAN